MEDKNNSQIPIKKDADKSYEELLAESTNDWTVEDLMVGMSVFDKRRGNNSSPGWADKFNLNIFCIFL